MSVRDDVTTKVLSLLVCRALPPTNDRIFVYPFRSASRRRDAPAALRHFCVRHDVQSPALATYGLAIFPFQLLECSTRSTAKLSVAHEPVLASCNSSQGGVTPSIRAASKQVKVPEKYGSFTILKTVDFESLRGDRLRLSCNDPSSFIESLALFGG